jgi:hypothetical protein
MSYEMEMESSNPGLLPVRGRNGEEKNPNSATAFGVRAQDQKPRRKQMMKTETPAVARIHYRGTNMYQAAGQGNLPVCVLLWGMSSAKRVDVTMSDAEGNSPLHHAATSENPEVCVIACFFCILLLNIR